MIDSTTILAELAAIQRDVRTLAESASIYRYSSTVTHLGEQTCARLAALMSSIAAPPPADVDLHRRAQGEGATVTLPGVAAPCVCHGQICGESPLGPLLYRCATCRRLVPWFFGAADDRPDDCDDCWAAAVLADEIKRGVRR